MNRNFILLLLCAALALLLAGCGSLPAAQQTAEPSAAPSAAPEEPTPEPTPEPCVYAHTWPADSETLRVAPEEIEDLCAQRALLPALNKIVLIETVTDAAPLEALRAAFPEAELSYRADVAGRLIDSAETELDLRWLADEDAAAACEGLRLLPNLTRLTLPDTASWETVGLMQELPGMPVVDKPFTLYGRSFNTADGFMDLNNVKIYDGCEALREALPYMTACYQLDMENCGISNENMAVLRDDFPQIKIVWRVRFSIYSVRTDETRILASIRDIGMNGATVACLKYCTEVRYLDLGHNLINDISFVSYMPDLEVAILAINMWSDASPLADCPKLEYLEMFNTRCTDLTPLAGLTNLKHLNIGWIQELRDITPLYGLTQLERLWIGCMNKVPREQLEEIQRRLPNTVVNVTTDGPTYEGWREGERYELLCEQMGYLPEPRYSLG